MPITIDIIAFSTLTSQFAGLLLAAADVGEDIILLMFKSHDLSTRSQVARETAFLGLTSQKPLAG